MAGGVLWLSPMVVIAWLLGAYTRDPRLYGGAERARGPAEREREETAAAAVASERARIARELHDIVAHSVSVMVVQAEAADEMLNRQTPERARAPVWKIQETGRAALTDMRRMLGLLRESDSRPALVPQPGIANLELLLAKVRESGPPGRAEVEGRPEPLPPGVDLSAYRIVQEALTNSLRYAGRAHARVVVRYGRGALELEVIDDGPGEAGDSTGGHGLIGMRERVALFGGELDAGPVPVVVSAFAPAAARGAAMIRVLIADDQTLVRDGFRMILDAQEDIEVVGEAADGIEAVAKARELRPRGGADGRSHAQPRWPRRDPRAAPGVSRATHVLILTTFDLNEYVYEAMKAGASGFLLKDAPRAQLIHGVRTVAAGDALLAPVSHAG